MTRSPETYTPSTAEKELGIWKWRAQSAEAMLGRVAALLEPRLVSDALHPEQEPLATHPVHIRARDLRAVLEEEEQEDHA